MTLATATPEGRPSARIVLLRGYDERGFAFFTNYESRKGRELHSNPHAALVFHWHELERQVRIEGQAERVSAEESDAYFQSRPALSPGRLGLASERRHPQSPVPGSAARLEIAIPTARFPVPNSGAATASSLSPSNSGRGVPAACTTACVTAVSMAAG